MFIGQKNLLLEQLIYSLLMFESQPSFQQPYLPRKESLYVIQKYKLKKLKIKTKKTPFNGNLFTLVASLDSSHIPSDQLHESLENKNLSKNYDLG